MTSRDSFGANPLGGNATSGNTMSRQGNTGLPAGFTPQNGSNPPSAKNSTPKQPNTPQNRTGNQAPNTAPKQPSHASAPKSSGKLPVSSEQMQQFLALVNTHKREIGAALLGLFAVVLLLALVSYDPADRSNARVSLTPEQSQTVATPRSANVNMRTAPTTVTTPLQEEYVIKNWLGYVGATVAHFVYNYTVGYAALLFPAMMMLWSVSILRYKISDRLLLGTALALVGAAILASFAGVLQLVPWMPPMRPEWSGSVGQFIARMLWQIIGTVGAFIVLTGSLIATIFVALDLDIEKSITRFKAERERLSALKNKTKSNIATVVKEEQAFTNESSTDAASMAAQFTEEILSAKDYDDYHVEMPATPSVSASVSAEPIPDTILSASAKSASTLADADEPARILRRSAQSPDATSLRRDILSKYAEDEAHDVESASKQEILTQSPVLVAPQVEIVAPQVEIVPQNPPKAEAEILSQAAQNLAPQALTAQAPVLTEKRVNIGATNSPTMSVSTPQTTVFAQGFSYPAQASITFVEATKAEAPKQETSVEDTKKNDELNDVSSAVLPETHGNAIGNEASKDASFTQNRFSDEELTVHRRNTEHLAGLVAGQVAEEVASGIATGIASQVAAEVAERIAHSAVQAAVQVAMEKAALTSTFASAAPVIAPTEATTPFVSDSFDADLVNEFATETLVAKPETLVAKTEVPITIRTNAQNVIPKPMFMPQNDEILREEIQYEPPTLDLLVPQEVSDSVSEEELQNNARVLQEKLRTFRIEIENLHVTPGPVVTQYEFSLAPGVKVSQIENLTNDIALALKARGIRIIAPVPGRGTVAVEIPNARATAVRFSSIVDSAEFEDSQLRLPLALGKTIHGDVFTADLAKMPHLLIAGATGSGKSVGINSIIASLLYKMHPRNLKFVIIDPKRVEMTQYKALANHFLAVCPDIDEKIITDAQNAVIALKSVVAEMTRRYEVLQKVGQRNIVDYNQKVREGRYKDTSDYVHHEMPYIVVIVDELADLMMTASREVEEPICRLAQLARAVGIHLIVATQRPSVDVVTGLIKANFPARIAYQVASKIDSRTILDSSGAEHLLGNGDMLFTPGGAGKPMRLQNSYLSTDEVERICDHIAAQEGFSQPYMLPSVSEKTQRGGGQGSDDDRDDLFEEAARLVVRHQQCSTSLLQRRMKIGYGRAARIVDQLEEAGVIGAMDGSKGRTVLLDSESALNAML
ncbi:MAG: DNA translocase FtsK [Candidatus Kapabacteria bacterium]|nr:DNA translocase FtsK [Candidatus Kapabacteria bacterium]